MSDRKENGTVFVEPFLLLRCSFGPSFDDGLSYGRRSEWFLRYVRGGGARGVRPGVTDQFPFPVRFGDSKCFGLPSVAWLWKLTRKTLDTFYEETTTFWTKGGDWDGPRSKSSPFTVSRFDVKWDQLKTDTVSRTTPQVSGKVHLLETIWTRLGDAASERTSSTRREDLRKRRRSCCLRLCRRYDDLTLWDLDPRWVFTDTGSNWWPSTHGNPSHESKE